MHEGLQALEACPGIGLRLGEPVARHSNLRLGGEVEAYLVIHTEDALAPTLATLRQIRLIPRFIYGFSDIIAHDDGLAGALIRLGRGFAGVCVEEGLLRIGVAAPLARAGTVARHAGLHELAVLERMPGTMGTWIEAVGPASFGDSLRALRVLAGRHVKEIRREGSSFPEFRGLVLDVVLQGRLPRGLSAPPPPGAILPLSGELQRKLTRAGLVGLRLRRVQLARECPGLAINLGGASTQDLVHLLQTVREKLLRDFGIEAEMRLVPAGRPTSRRAS